MAELPPPPAPSEIPAGFPRVPYRRPRTEPLTASSIVGKTMKVWFSTLPQLLAVAALVHVPRFAVAWYFRSQEPSPSLARLAEAFQNLELLLIPALVGVFAVYFVFQRLRAERADLGRSVATGARRIGTALGIFALFAIPQVAFVFTTQNAVSTLTSGSHIDTGAAGIGVLVFLTMAICNLAFALYFQAALPAAVVERLGIFSALGRSARLTSGRRLMIFGANFIFGLLTGVIATPILIAAGLQKDSTSQFVLTAVVTWILASLQCVFPIVLYHELRRTKEGFGAEELAKAFD